MMQALVVFALVYLLAHSAVMFLALLLQTMLFGLAWLGPWLAWIDGLDLGQEWWSWLAVESLLVMLWACVRARERDFWDWLRP